MKRLILLSLNLFFLVNLLGNNPIQSDLNNLRNQEIHNVSSNEYYKAIYKLDVKKVQDLIKQLPMNKRQKNILLNEINNMIRNRTKSALIKLICGVPVGGIGFHFFYKSFLERKDLWNAIKNSEFNFLTIGDSLKNCPKQLVFANWGFSRTKMRALVLDEIITIKHYRFNILVPITAILCSYFGSDLIIKGLRQFFAGDIKKLKEIKHLIENVKEIES